MTPAFARYLEDDEAFLKPALQHIYGDFTSSITVDDIECSVAVVSRLPSPRMGPQVDRTNNNSTNFSLSQGHEGIALWVDSLAFEADLLGNPFGDHSEERVVKTVFLRPINSKELITSFELPSANTLFINGARHTMFWDRWSIGNDDVVSPRVTRKSHRQPLKSLELFVPSRNLTFEAPLEALTASRKIATSMGNIIRQVEHDNVSGLASASAELEEKVPQYLSRRKGTGGTLRVFALVYPPALAGALHLHTVIKPRDGNLGSSEMASFQEALFAGAHLHRVTSGGGGWGKKQGLLSLDPAFDFSEIGDTGSLDSVFEQSEPEPSANNTNAVTPGDFVQFFASFDPEQRSASDSDLSGLQEVDTSMWKGVEWTASNQYHMIVGSIPSQDEYVMAPQVGQQSCRGFIGIPNHFGLLAEGGTCLRQLEPMIAEPKPSSTASNGALELKQTARTRLDVPYGLWETST